MDKVQVYNTQEEMWKQVGRKVYKNNRKTQKRFEYLHEKALLEYKEESGFNKRFLEAQEKRKKENPYTSTFSPDMVHLLKKEQEKFNDHYHDLGKSLEQTVLVTLMTDGNKYSLGEGNKGELLNSFDEGTEYDNIASLAQGAKEEFSKIEYFGIKFTPVFYTTREELAIVPEHISNDPEGYLQGMRENVNHNESRSSEFEEQFMEALQDFAYCKDKIRGLTEEECSEFEKLFYQQDHPNTP